MSIGAVMPAAIAVAVSLAGFLYVRYITFKFDRAYAEESGAAEGGQIVTVDLDAVEQASSSRGIKSRGLSEHLRHAPRETIEVPVKVAQH